MESHVGHGNASLFPIWEQCAEWKQAAWNSTASLDKWGRQVSSLSVFFSRWLIFSVLIYPVWLSISFHNSVLRILIHEFVFSQNINPTSLNVPASYFWNKRNGVILGWTFCPRSVYPLSTLYSEYTCTEISNPASHNSWHYSCQLDWEPGFCGPCTLAHSQVLCPPHMDPSGMEITMMNILRHMTCTDHLDLIIANRC